MRNNAVEKHFDEVAMNYDIGKSKYSFYYKSLKNLLASLIPQNSKVFEIGCGTGDLLASLKPKYGYGMDVSSRMVEISKIKHQKSKNLKFSTIWPSGHFDYIFMSDVIEHLVDPKTEFQKARKLMTNKTILINTNANPIWEPLLMFWERRGWKMKEGPHKRIKHDEFEKIINNAGMKIVKHDYHLLIPVDIPFITLFVNRYLEKYLKKLAFIEYFVISTK